MMNTTARSFVRVLGTRALGIIFLLAGCGAETDQSTTISTMEALSTPVCATGAERATVRLSCPTGQTIQAIDFASYGTPGGTCGSFSQQSCDATTSRNVVSTACLGKGSCAVGAANGTFGDPCVGTVKHLFIQASCAATSPVTGNDAGVPPPPDGSVPGQTPPVTCATGIPAQGQPSGISSPTTVVGSGTAASCTFAQLQTAVALGGVITFNCGINRVTIPISTTMHLPTNKSTVIDGGSKITLDGRGSVQILSFNSLDFRANDNTVTLQHIALVNGKATPIVAIPPAAEPCSQGWDDGQGGALYMRDGNLVVIDATFTNNQAALLGPDTGGGAIYVFGSKRGAVIVNTTFTANRGSNAAALGALYATLAVYNSSFIGNTATGHGANYDDGSRCSVINNGQHEVGSGGNGGAIYSDGQGANVLLCGVTITDNKAASDGFGGGLFFTSNDMTGTLSIANSAISGNTGGWWTNVATGSITNVGTAIGVNAKSIMLTTSSVQGVP
jgi:hypothetical protein